MTAKSTKTANISKAAPIQKTESISLKSVLERIDEGNRLKTVFLNFDERLKGVEEFRTGLDGSGLSMQIQDIDGNHISFNNVNMITSFIDEAIKVGKEHLAGMEVDLLSMYPQA